MNYFNILTKATSGLFAAIQRPAGCQKEASLVPECGLEVAKARPVRGQNVAKMLPKVAIG